MSQSVAAKRYALALFELAQKNGQTGPIQEDLLELKKVFQTNKELGQLLDSPRLKATKKKELMADLFKGANPAHFEYIIPHARQKTHERGCKPC